jgi:hypothetical protein
VPSQGVDTPVPAELFSRNLDEKGKR